MSAVADNTPSWEVPGVLLNRTTCNRSMTPVFTAARLVAMLGLPFYLVIYTPTTCGPLSAQDVLWYLSVGCAAGYVLYSAVESIRDELL